MNVLFCWTQRKIFSRFGKHSIFSYYGSPKQPDYKLSSEYLPLCSEQTHSYRSGTTWGWVNDRIFIFGWTVPLRSESCVFQLLTHKIFPCHTVSESCHSNSRNTPKPDTNSQPLTQFSISFCKTQHTVLYVTHKHLAGINITSKMFANVYFWDVFVIFWMHCFVLQEMWSILCARFLDLCVEFKKNEVPLQEIRAASENARGTPSA